MNTLTDLGVTMSTEFVPFSQSRQAQEKSPSLNWRVTIYRHGVEVLTVDYAAGMGHCPGYKREHVTGGTSYSYRTNVTRMVCDFECERGIEGWYRESAHRVDAKPGHKKIEPDLPTVMHALIMDASVLDCRDFSDWCACYGMDDDSIKAKATYDECLREALALRYHFGDDEMTAMSEALSDL